MPSIGLNVTYVDDWIMGRVNFLNYIFTFEFGLFKSECYDASKLGGEFSTEALFVLTVLIIFDFSASTLLNVFEFETVNGSLIYLG